MRVAVTGVGGRMGSELVRSIINTKNLILVAALENKDSPWLGEDVGVLVGGERLGVKVTDDFTKFFIDVEAILDFTKPEASIFYAAQAADKNIVHVIGTTGFSQNQEREIKQLASRSIVIKSSNMSLGVNLLVGLAKKAAKTLQAENFDVEILEMHHRHKKDAPSGTALLLGQAVANGRGVDLANWQVRSGYIGPREQGMIGFATLRGGSVIGEHSVIFAGSGERVTLSHSAEDRSIFAHGAIYAALWGRGKPSGLYSMLDVLGIED